MRTHHALLSVFLLAAGTSATAQEFPNRTVRIVVAGSPGAGADIVARLLAEPMRADLGQSVVVENKVGAGGMVGAIEVARAAPDGHTVLFTAGALAIAPSVYAKPQIDVMRDLRPVALVAHVPLVLVARPESPLNSVADLVALAKREGSKVTFASFGNATPPHLVGESMNQIAGLSMTHVPYKVTSTAVTDIIGGLVTFGILDAVAMTPQIKGGRLKALAVTGPKRFHALPDRPTLAESGIPFETVGWHGIFAPGGVPTPIVNRLNAAIVKAAGRPEIRERIVAGGSVPIEPPLSAEQWTARFREDVESWGKVAKAAKVTADSQ